jgi:hypothetical protein
MRVSVNASLPLSVAQRLETEENKSQVIAEALRQYYDLDDE